jgi:hypothetical protein
MELKLFNVLQVRAKEINSLTQSHLVIYCPIFTQFVLKILCDADLTLGVNQIRSSPVLTHARKENFLSTCGRFAAAHFHIARRSETKRFSIKHQTWQRRGACHQFLPP